MQLVEKTDLTKLSTQAALKKLLSLKNPPKAIISFNDYVHMDAVQYAEKKGIAVNKDIIFVSYANLPITEYTAHPPAASIEQFPYEQGKKAMEKMIYLLQNKQAHGSIPPYINEELNARLIVHSSSK